MLVTTVLVSLVMLVVWDKPLALVLPFFLFFFIFEGVYFTANIRKARTSQFQASTCHIFKTTFWRIGHFPDFPFVSATHTILQVPNLSLVCLIMHSQCLS
jgi:glucose uptake protein GlcU